MSNRAKLFSQATAAHRDGRLDEAEKYYRKLLALDARHPDALRLLGGLYLQRSQWAAAHQYMEPAAQLRPNDPETLTNAALALRGIGRRDEALALMLRALAINPDYAAALGNLGGLYLETGRYAEALEHYGQILRQHPDNAVAHYNYGNALLAAGQSVDAAARFEQALKLKPDYLQAMINLGMALARAGNADGSRQWLSVAQAWFEKALAADPTNVVALNNYGNILRQKGEPAQAVAYYHRALALRPDYAEASINLATALRDIGRHEEAIESCKNALRLKPDSVDAHTNLGVFYQDLSRHGEAVDSFAAALRLKPASIDAKWNQSLSLLALGRYVEGWALHEVGLGIIHMRGDYPSPERRWDGQPFEGKRLMIWSEQGFGDSLQFIRYAALCKKRGGTVLVLCPPVIRGLLRHCPFIDELPDSADAVDYDFHAPMMSLPHIFGTELDSIPADIPYLFVGEKKRMRWAGYMAGAELKVGLVWAGNPREQQINANMIDRRRSMSLEALRSLFAIEGIKFCNLQMGEASKQIDICGLRAHFVDPMDEVQDFEDTAALVEQLDLVISVDTSVVHLVGGMGRPIWVLSRFDACWRWLQNRPDNPWYPSARVFGQSKPGDWAGVVEKVRAELVSLAALSR